MASKALDTHDHANGYEHEEDVKQDSQLRVTTSDSFAEPTKPDSRVYLASSGLVLSWIAQTEIQTLCVNALAAINADLGPITNYPWIYIAWLGSVATLSGVLGVFSDVLGRRYFLIVGNVLALIGAIICATTHSANVVIVGMTIGGLGAANQYLAVAAISELFPRKDRAYVQGALQIIPFPFTACGALITFRMINHTWRWIYYLNIIITGLALIAIALFYHPIKPYPEISSWKLIKSLDWFGACVFTVGFFSLILGASPAAFGLHGWSSPAVLVPICVGILILIGMGFWNSRHSKPLIPVVLLRNTRGFLFLLLTVAAIIVPLEVCTFIWSSQVQAMYTTDPTRIGLYNFPTGFGSELGFLIAAFSIRRGRTNVQLAVACLLLAIFVGLQATLTPGNVRPGLAYLSIAGVSIGFIQVILVVIVQFATTDEHIGAATGVYFVFRWVGAAIGITIGLTIVRSKVGSTWPAAVAKAVIPLGLPQKSLPALLGALATGSPTAIMKVPGITPAIIEAATVATKNVYAAAYRLVYYPSLALGIVATVVAFFTTDIAPMMINSSTVRLRRQGFLTFGKPTKEVAP